MEHSPSWEANRFSASQEIHRILWNLKVHHCFRKCPPPVPILSQLVPVHTPHTISWRSIIIIYSHMWLGLPSGLLPPSFPHQNPFCTSPLRHTCHMSNQSHSSWFYHPKNIGWAVQIISSFLCSFLHSSVISSLLGPHILLSTLFSNTLTLRSSLNVSDQVSHPYKTKRKIIVMYILIFFFFWISN